MNNGYEKLVSFEAVGVTGKLSELAQAHGLQLGLDFGGGYLYNQDRDSTARMGWGPAAEGEEPYKVELYPMTDDAKKKEAFTAMATALGATPDGRWKQVVAAQNFSDLIGKIDAAITATPKVKSWATAV